MDIQEGRIRVERLNIDFDQALLPHTSHSGLNYIIWPRIRRRSNFG